MQSVVNTIAPHLLEEALPPWAKFNWSPKVQQDIYKSWGAYYTRRRREITSLYYYDRALKLEPLDFVTRYHRSQSKRKLAQPESALEDCRAAAELAPLLRGGEQSAAINVEVCDALYDLNRFEDSLTEIHNNLRYFAGNKTKAFKHRLVVVSENINDCVGDALAPFILKNAKAMDRAQELNKERLRIETRPLWKVMKADGKCDVLSVLEREEKWIPPLQLVKRKRDFDLFNQTYLGRAWIDVLFLKEVNKHHDVLLEQTPESTEYLRNLLDTEDDVLRKFRKMMHARSPMYYIRHNKISDFERLQRYHEDYLYRVQYQTRRNMIQVLRTVRKLRKEKQINKLTTYVEEVMGGYFILKKLRVMPWKFVFTTEVYYILGLAYTDQYIVPHAFGPIDFNGLKKLLHLPTSGPRQSSFKKKFGSRETPHDVDDKVAQNLKKYIAQLEYRYPATMYPITRTYIFHQIAHAHFKQNRFDESCFFARRAVEESMPGNSYLWRFLSYLLMCKSHATLYKIDKCREVLNAALTMAYKLKSPKLVHFVETCLRCNENESIIKKASLSTNQSRETTDSVRE